MPAANGEEALKHLGAGPRRDLILLDMLMPVLDGWHFLEALQGEGRPPPVPVVITTGTIPNREWAESHGCRGFLRKLIDTGPLLEEVEAGAGVGRRWTVMRCGAVPGRGRVPTTGAPRGQRTRKRGSRS